MVTPLPLTNRSIILLSTRVTNLLFAVFELQRHTVLHVPSQPYVSLLTGQGFSRLSLLGTGLPTSHSSHPHIPLGLTCKRDCSGWQPTQNMARGQTPRASGWRESSANSSGGLTTPACSLADLAGAGSKTRLRGRRGASSQARALCHGCLAGTTRMAHTSERSCTFSAFRDPSRVAPHCEQTDSLL